MLATRQRPRWRDGRCGLIRTESCRCDAMRFASVAVDITWMADEGSRDENSSQGTVCK